jgi:lysophospholipase L1-like esterase
MIQFTQKQFTAILCVVVILLFTCCITSPNQPVREADYRSPIRVACIGDSITFGFGIKDREHDSYPARLSALLGDKWEVRNFGVGSATALKQGGRPYMHEQAYRDALAFKPDVVLVQLGTNDTNEKDWPKHKREFTADYLNLVESFARLESKPRIYLCRPVPLFRDRRKKYDNDKVLKEEVIPRINDVARRKHLPVIDLYSSFEDKAALFFDGVHPNKKGAQIMAEVIFAKVIGRPALVR